MNTEQKPSTRVRAVIDTNVIVSGLNFPGNERQILNLGHEGKIEAYLSLFILEEVERVLQRKFSWTPAEAESALRAIRSWATIIQPRIQVSVIQRDKADNRILECASESEAHYLVTGDQRDLRPLKEFEGVRIVSPVEFLEILGSNR